MTRRILRTELRALDQSAPLVQIPCRVFRGGSTLSFRSSEQLNNTVKTANGTFSAGRYEFLKMYSGFSCYGRKLEILADACKFTNRQYKETHAVAAFAAGNLEDFRELASSKVLFCVSRTGGRPKNHLGICEWHNWCRKCGPLCSRMHPGRDRFWGSSKMSWQQFWLQWAETCTFSALMKDALVCAGCFGGGACPHCHLEWGVRPFQKTWHQTEGGSSSSAERLKATLFVCSVPISAAGAERVFTHVADFDLSPLYPYV